ncbi:MAG: MBL fold metallo-hydrolase [Dictyoglomus sp. NZ13-RE01]|nr:MAG: MBL fold metallo-hydrolase [Dictyoglomus sp. NZ13-RE01]
MDTLDSLSVRVIVENSVMQGSSFWGLHGISFYVTAIKDNFEKHFLIDVGQSHEVLLHNMKLMEIDPNKIDAIILTHCHYDHTNGLAGLLKEIGKSNIPIIAHPDLFRINFADKPYLRYIGMSTENAELNLEKLGATFFLTSDSLQLMPGLITTGYVPRITDFEEGTSFKTIDMSNRIVQDYMNDDISVVGAIKGKGLVILTGCGHAGIVNIVKHAIELTGISKVVSIIGGLHLVDASMERIMKTVDTLYSLGVESIYAGHCTGFNAQVELRKKFGTQFMPLQVGNYFKF